MANRESGILDSVKAALAMALGNTIARPSHAAKGNTTAPKGDANATQFKKLLKVACEGNPNPNILFRLGCCYAKGKGVSQSIDTAIEWWRKAAAKGHRGAQKRLRKYPPPTDSSSQPNLRSIGKLVSREFPTIEKRSVANDKAFENPDDRKSTGKESALNQKELGNQKPKSKQKNTQKRNAKKRRKTSTKSYRDRTQTQH